MRDTADLSEPHQALFRIGDAFFTEPWTPAGEGNEDRDGLGSTFLSTSCAGCRVADGWDTPLAGDGLSSTPIVRFSDSQGWAVEIENYGVQLQSQAVQGVPAEGTVGVAWIFLRNVPTAMARRSCSAGPSRRFCIPD